MRPTFLKLLFYCLHSCEIHNARYSMTKRQEPLFLFFRFQWLIFSLETPRLTRSELRSRLQLQLKLYSTLFHIVDIEISIRVFSNLLGTRSYRAFGYFLSICHRKRSMRNFDPFSRVYYPLDVVDKFKNALYLVVEFNSFFTKLYMTIVLNDIASDRRLRFPLRRNGRKRFSE